MLEETLHSHRTSYVEALMAVMAEMETLMLS